MSDTIDQSSRQNPLIPEGEAHNNTELKEEISEQCCAPQKGVSHTPAGRSAMRLLTKMTGQSFDAPSLELAPEEDNDGASAGRPAMRLLKIMASQSANAPSEQMAWDYNAGPAAVDRSAMRLLKIMTDQSSNSPAAQQEWEQNAVQLVQSEEESKKRFGARTWFSQQLAQKQEQIDLRPVVWTSMLLGLVLLPLSMLLVFQLIYLVPPLAHSLGALISSNWVILVTRMLPGFSVVIIGILGLIFKRVLQLPPTHLIIKEDRLIACRISKQSTTPTNYAFNERRNLLTEVMDNGVNILASLGWWSIARISVDPKPRGGAQILCFHTNAGEIVRLRLGDVLNQEARSKLLKALREWAPNAVIEPDAYNILMPQPDVSYTELWISALSAPPTRERIAPLGTGTMIGAGNYEVVRQLASGGQGTVYVAKNIGSPSKQTVVLKEYILPMHVNRDAATKAIQSLEHEARTLQHLDHPAIVKLIDFFVEDHRGYMVLEHVQGKNLRDMVSENGPLSQKAVCELAIGMCNVLSYLHAQQPPVIHRDFTPDNLILEDNGNLKLIDFNVAQEATTGSCSTVVGKRSYMPPEQFRGAPCPQSDIYALGACIYFLLIGEDPEPLSTLTLLEIKPEVSEALNKILSGCTQLSLESRYQTTAELAADLAAVNHA